MRVGVPPRRDVDVRDRRRVLEPRWPPGTPSPDASARRLGSDGPFRRRHGIETAIRPDSMQARRGVRPTPPLRRLPPFWRTTEPTMSLGWPCAAPARREPWRVRGASAGAWVRGCSVRARCGAAARRSLRGAATRRCSGRPERGLSVRDGRPARPTPCPRPSRFARLRCAFAPCERPPCDCPRCGSSERGSGFTYAAISPTRATTGGRRRGHPLRHDLDRGLAQQRLGVLALRGQHRR